MQRNTIVATALGLTLAVGALTGCSGQQASTSADADGAATTEATAEQSAEQSVEELAAEFKQALQNAPAYTSVTLNVEESSQATGDADPISSTTVYKFDASGDALRTSAQVDIGGVQLSYYTEGDNAVFVSDGPVYGGTNEQFDLIQAQGVDAFMNDLIGDYAMFADMSSDIEKMESNGLTFYLMTVDSAKYIEADESLKGLADSGSALQGCDVTVGFEEDGSICSVDRKLVFGDVVALKNVGFSDYDATVVDPMPEATSTYEQMLADEEAKLDEVFGED